MHGLTIFSSKQIPEPCRGRHTLYTSRFRCSSSQKQSAPSLFPGHYTGLVGQLSCYLLLLAKDFKNNLSGACPIAEPSLGQATSLSLYAFLIENDDLLYVGSSSLLNSHLLFSALHRSPNFNHSLSAFYPVPSQRLHVPSPPW
jgi:hypothetical protein